MHSCLLGGCCRYKEELLQHIEAHNLPDCYGGALSFSWWVPGCTAAGLHEYCCNSAEPVVFS